MEPHKLVLTQSVAPFVESAQRIGLAWLIRLRWAAVTAQVALVLFASYALHLEFRVDLVASLIAIAVISNAILHWRVRRLGEASITVVLVLDTLLLTGMLLATGGPSNPFSVFYLVHVALAAMLLSAHGTWILAATTTVCFGVLFAASPASPHVHMHGGGDFGMHLRGMWLSYAIAAVAIGYFVTRVKHSLAEREERLTSLDAMRLRSEQIVALSALAAGAAHELGTPLATIALIAKELELASKNALEGARLTEDVSTIRAEVERCRAILATMGDRSGDAQVGSESIVPVSTIVAELRKALGNRAGRLVIKESATNVRAQLRPLVQALVNLVINALDASADPVELGIIAAANEVSFVVSDRGSGMTRETLARVGEPFFTTKPASRGFGLGLFLVRTFAERARARLEIVSTPGVGTRVELAMRGEA